MKINCRIISNEQLNKLYEIRDYILEYQREVTDNMTMGSDEDTNYVINLCDNLLDELDPSSDYNQGTLDDIN